MADGMRRARRPGSADVVVVNTCAFIDKARAESIEVILDLAERRKPGARLVVTGCMAERYGEQLGRELPEVDLVAGFGVPVTLGRARASSGGRSAGDGVGGEAPTAAALPKMDLLEMARPPAEAPWAYVKVAEGCDRSCGFCAIPSFRGPQRSRSIESVLAEVERLGAAEIVLVAQDLASYGRDIGRPGSLVELVGRVSRVVERTRLVYLYPSQLNGALVEAILATGVPYFDLSLQHVSRPLLRRMRRWGDKARFIDRIDAIRRSCPGAAFRSSFIVGYPGETEEDHDMLLQFLVEARLDWAGFFSYSAEEGTFAAGLDDQVPDELAAERLREASELQDRVTASLREELVGQVIEVLVDRPGFARSYREAPEIDGIVEVPEALPVGRIAEVEVTAAAGPDLVAVPVAAGEPGLARNCRAAGVPVAAGT